MPTPGICPPMTVEVIAATKIVALPSSVEGTPFGDRLRRDLMQGIATDMDLLAELAGRGCYLAWDMPSPATAKNEGYLANITSQAHFSVLEHAHVTLHVAGVTRSLSHQLERHRHLSYSELSQRYVDMAEVMAVVPPLFRDDPEAVAIIAENLASTKAAYARLVERGDQIIAERGARDGADEKAVRREGRKKVREAARSALPDVETRFHVTGNIRAWRDVLVKRHSVHADAQIQEMALAVFQHLRTLAPNSTQDIPEEPYR